MLPIRKLQSLFLLLDGAVKHEVEMSQSIPKIYAFGQ